MAMSLGRAFALSSMVRVLGREDVSLTPAHLQQAERALLREAARGNAKATTSLLRFYQSGVPFGKREEQAAALLKARAGKSDAVAAYQLAVLLLSESGEDEAKRREIIGYLEIARDHGTIGISASATNLLRMLSTKKEV
jgi:TPR repeat protein